MWQLQQLQARHMVLDNSCSSITGYTYIYIYIYIQTSGSHFLHVGAHVAAAAAAGTPHGA
jgi:hypothetical protein